MKAKTIALAKQFTDLPNVGPRIAADFMLLGFKKPTDLKKKDPFKLYKELEKRTRSKQDPCVLDTFMAVCDFANGASPKSWFAYTKERKKKYNL